MTHILLVPRKSVLTMYRIVIYENNDSISTRIQQHSQLLATLNQIDHLQLWRTIIGLITGKTTTQKHHQLDLVHWYRHTRNPVVAIFEVIDHDIKAVFKGAIDLQKELFIRIRVINHQLHTNDLLQLNEDVLFYLGRLRNKGDSAVALVFLFLPYHKTAFFPSSFE